MPINFGLINPEIMQTTVNSVQQMLMNKAQRDQMEAQSRNQNNATNVAATNAFNSNNQEQAKIAEAQRANMAQEQNQSLRTQDQLANSEVARATDQFKLGAAQEDRQRQQMLQQDLAKSDGSIDATAKIYQKYGLADKAMELKKAEADIHKAVLQGESSWMSAKSKEKQVDLAYRQSAFNEGVQQLMGIKDPTQRADASLRLAQQLDALGGDTRLQDMSSEVREQAFMSQALSANKNLKTLIDSGLAKEYMPGIAASMDQQGNPWLNPKTGTSEIKNVMAVKALRDAGMTEEADKLEAQVAKKNTLSMTTTTDANGQPVSPLTKPTANDAQKKVTAGLELKMELKNLVSLVEKNPEVFTYASQGAVTADNLAKKAGFSGLPAELGGAYAELQRGKQEQIFTNGEQLFNTYRQLITGAAAADKEIERLREVYFNKDLDPATALIRTKILEQKISRAIDMYSEYLNSGVPLSKEAQENLISYVLTPEAEKQDDGKNGISKEVPYTDEEQAMANNGDVVGAGRSAMQRTRNDPQVQAAKEYLRRQAEEEARRGG